jgi:hypothetical protein
MRHLLGEHLRLLRFELDERGFDAVRSNARDLGSLARRFEVRPVAELCRSLETAARAEMEHEARSCLVQLETFLSRCKFVCQAAPAIASPAAAAA